MAFKVALIGYGYWGLKLARNIQNSNNFEINHIIDKSKKSWKAKRSFPLSKFSTNFKDIDKDKIDLVVISTPTKTHYQLTKYFLKYSNVLVEKPLALKLKDVKNLEFLSKKANINYSLIILIFSGSINYIKKILKNKKYGKLIEIESFREQAPIRTDADVVWILCSWYFNIKIFA